MTELASPLLAVLVEPGMASDFDGAQWSLLLAEARACGLLPRLEVVLQRADMIGRIPKRFAVHLAAARVQGEALIRDVRRELAHLETALRPAAVRVLLLKGGAYVGADLPPAQGRVFSDIDILVRREHLPRAEGALLLGGWAAAEVDAYDQRYYREWSHEVPPMTHRGRGTTVDLHHSLVMPTCRIQVDSERMIAEAVPVSGHSFWWRLRDEDLVLHAVAHLLLNGEFDRALRDLGDIDRLLRHFEGMEAGFADRVAERAAVVGLDGLVCQGFALCWLYFRTPGLAAFAGNAAGGLVMSLLRCASGPRHPDTRPAWQPLADLLLMVREVSLRLPPRLLVRHLAHKVTATVVARAQEAN